jgi:hypothetical protein
MQKVRNYLLRYQARNSGSVLRLGAQARHSCLRAWWSSALYMREKEAKEGRICLRNERSTHAAILDLGKLWRNSVEDQVIG